MLSTILRQRSIASTFVLGAMLVLMSGCTFTLAPAATVPPAPAVGCTAPNMAVVDYRAVIDAVDAEMVQALKAFPKGGDIHNHMTGAMLPEVYIALGTEGNFCYDPSTFGIADSCSADTASLAEADATALEQVKQALSMYEFDYTDIQSGHDHFFSTFGKFSAVADSYDGRILAQLLQDAAAENVTYVETMMYFGYDEQATLQAALAKAFPADADYLNVGNFPKMLAVLQENGLADAVATARDNLDEHEQTARTKLQCDSAAAGAACDVTHRFIGEVSRNSRPPLALSWLFVEAAINFSLVEADARVVGVNLVGGEDSSTSLENFAPQMAIFTFFTETFPSAKLALHAGELTPCFVADRPSALLEHLTGSLAAGADRLGHGVSFAYLNEAQQAQVAEQLLARDALVEIPLTSNAQILGVAGDEHPFPLYLREYGVPVAFATDDKGVSYGDFTDVWLYAWSFYDLCWEELKLLARNSLQYSFLAGASLWLDVVAEEIQPSCAQDELGAPAQSDACQAFLARSDKATVQWQHEIELREFVEEYGELFGD